MSGMAPKPFPAAPGDMGRRVAKRREELGLTREEVAARAGMATSYLRFIEEQSTAAPGPGTLGTLAAVLDTTVTALSGGEADLPPGRRGRASPHARLMELSSGECWSRLDGHGVGRVAVTTPGREAILPVNYSVVDRSVVFRTAPGSGPAEVVGTEVVFEVDHVDEALSQGWSVLVRGLARRVEDPEAVRYLAQRVYSGPWPGDDDRVMWVRIEAGAISGRRIDVP
ncbi:pyridoxamine 5'-phosphate oxidase family protein [Actinacidiphila glaucinigra]|uniref:pyridoxamine 5'-phosphate oxidase family protein n=1 Tax=Actinacidiphila glaucinigra TaxID=235986 RepID=UPI00367021CE